MEPKRGVLFPCDIEKWEKSEAYQDILGFLMAMNDSIKGKKLSCNCIQSDAVNSLSSILSIVSCWIDEIPPVDQPQRYGNSAFRNFYSKLKENSLSEFKKVMPEKHHSSFIEIVPYFNEAFGNSTRIDYGTGHELSFIMFLCSLHKIGVLTSDDYIATVTVLFRRYLDLCRKLQTTYKMEPAGSQGVWSLDDYQFVPFIWGSSQLVMHPKISPEMFTNEKVLQEHADDYLFLSCIQYIMRVKTGPFAEHSNQLWNISGVQSWSKINQGLFKMYKAEILNKFPIIQHVLFGSILSLSPAKTIQFQPPMEMGAVKSSMGMSRTSYRTGMAPGPGRMPSGSGIMVPGMERMPPCTRMMPPGPELMPSGLQKMPPCSGSMPLNSGVIPPGYETKPPSITKQRDTTEIPGMPTHRPEIEKVTQQTENISRPCSRSDITTQPSPDIVPTSDLLPSAAAIKITPSMGSKENLNSDFDTNLDKSKLLNT